MNILEITIAIVGGFLAGFINTLAGSGSAITLTILMEVLGLPPNVANATNRVGLGAQALAAAAVFKKGGKLDLKSSKAITIPLFIGAMIGLYFALNVSNEQFRSVFKILILFMLVIVLIKPKRWLKETDASKRPHWLIIAPMFLLLGFYGGFIQMGMGVFFMAAMVLVARYSITDTNAIKNLIVGLYTLVVLAIFAYHGWIDWLTGLTIAAGQILGGVVASRFAVKIPNANLWSYRILVIAIILVVVKVYIFN